MNNNIVKNLFPERRNTRLRGFDYSLPGAYFVTICTLNKQTLFGAIAKNTMQLNSIGRITQKCWEDNPQHYAGIDNYIFVVMPNHVHGIILIQGENRRSGSKPDPTMVHPWTEIVRAFKTFSSKGINEHRNSPGIRIWQHSYYEHIIRSEKEYREIAEYVMYNPAKWQNDDNNIFGSKKVFCRVEFRTRPPTFLGNVI